MTEWLMTPERVHENGPKRGLRPGWRLNLSGATWARSVLLDAASREEAIGQAAAWINRHLGELPAGADVDLIWK